jgi:D-alanyl-D-alanine carboxypeptidase (penicillin-binding protein 5/6)
VRRVLHAAMSAAVLALVGASAAGAATPVATPVPQAPAAVVFQPDTGDVVYRRAPTERRPIASTTKLMTALVTRDQVDLDDTLTAVRYPANPAESLMGLRAGERVTVQDLLEGLLLASGNDAAATLAERVGGSRRAFVRLMNERARELGLRDTHFANPIGLDDPRNYSTAADLAKLALVVLRDPFFARTVDRPRVAVESGGRRRTLVNRNTLVREVPWISGVKTGHTSQAAYVLVGAATRDGVRLVSAVLGAPNEAARDADTLALLRWGLTRYRSTTPVRAGQVLAQPKLAFRDQRAALVADRAVRVVVRAGERSAVRVRGVPDELSGPLDAGERVGTIVVSRRGKVVAEVPLVTAESVAAASIGDRLASALAGPWLILLLAVLAICSLHVALRRRRRIRRRDERGRRRGGTETA